MSNAKHGQEKLDYCIENVDEITGAAEIDFIEQLNDRMASWEEMSEKQQSWVEDIYAKLSV